MKKPIFFILLLIVSLGGFGSGSAQSGPSEPVVVTQSSGGLVTHEAGQPEGISTAQVDPAVLADEDLEPGFPVKSLLTPGSYQGGTVIHTRVGNIDADPELEILASGMVQGPLHAWNYDGSVVPGWPRIFLPWTFYPALGNLADAYSGLEVFAGQFIWRVSTEPPGPLLLYAGDGTMLSGWPQDSENNIHSPAILADLDGDGMDEIIIDEGASPTVEEYLFAYEANGDPLPGWPIPSENYVYAVGDLDQDGDLEIVTVDNASSEGADLVAYHHTGEQMEGFYFRIRELFQHTRPMVADVDGDGSNEVLMMAGGFGPPPDNEYTLWVHVIAPDGTVKQLLKGTFMNNGLYMDMAEAPALADMDQDGTPEIILAFTCGIVVYKGDGSYLDGWPVTWECPPAHTSMAFGAPVVGDVDGDGLPDILTETLLNVYWNSQTEIRVYNTFGQLNPHFPKTLLLGKGAMPAIADIDLDGRNEIVITSNFWGGQVEEFDKVWVYDLGGGPDGAVEWGQLGGGPQNWNLYPPPPTYSGSNVYLAGPPQTSASLEEAGIPVRYGNHGVARASEVILTVTLDDGMTYLRDSSGVTPTISGPVITWVLPDFGFRVEKQFGLVVGMPVGTGYGDTFSVDLRLENPGREADPSDDAQQITLVVAKQTYLPAIIK